LGRRGLAPATLRCGGATLERNGGGVVRGEGEVVPPFYSPERTKGRGVEAVGGEVGGRLKRPLIRGDQM
jgi:hypothetical protein